MNCAVLRAGDLAFRPVTAYLPTGNGKNIYMKVFQNAVAFLDKLHISAQIQ